MFFPSNFNINFFNYFEKHLAKLVKFTLKRKLRNFSVFFLGVKNMKKIVKKEHIEVNGFMMRLKEVNFYLFWIVMSKIGSFLNLKFYRYIFFLSTL